MRVQKKCGLWLGAAFFVMLLCDILYYFFGGDVRLRGFCSLGVFGVAYGVEPSGFVCRRVAFDRQVGEVGIGCCAVPMHDVRRDFHNVARAQKSGGFALFLIESRAADCDEDLSARVAMPVVAAGRFERDVVDWNAERGVLCEWGNIGLARKEFGEGGVFAAERERACLCDLRGVGGEFRLFGFRFFALYGFGDFYDLRELFVREPVVFGDCLVRVKLPFDAVTGCEHCDCGELAVAPRGGRARKDVPEKVGFEVFVNCGGELENLVFYFAPNKFCLVLRADFQAVDFGRFGGRFQKRVVFAAGFKHVHKCGERVEAARESAIGVYLDEYFAQFGGGDTRVEAVVEGAFKSRPVADCRARRSPRQIEVLWRQNSRVRVCGVECENCDRRGGSFFECVFHFLPPSVLFFEIIPHGARM